MSDAPDTRNSDPAGDPAGVTGLANAVGRALGVNFAAQASTPLADVLDSVALKIFSLFLEQILRACAFVLALLGVIVLFALALGDVEAKRFELGMLRALGLRRVVRYVIERKVNG